MRSTIHRRTAYLLLTFVLLAAGCVPTEATRHDRRHPGPHRTSSRAERTMRVRIARDADRYVRELDRHLRLNARQEQRLAHVLADRAYDRVHRTRARDRDRAYPFPRRHNDRYTRDWWHQMDRSIERALSHRQRAVYRDLVRDRYERGRPRGNARGHHGH